ncbi:uncharacterized protein LOC114761183 [Neltuma alba]|uniref:uncharacterized protein LOC114761183 n=1 Tax=Neltuma alba TaxID=207710 RepID=UPI0010A39FC4|nr:uncharacterized protein LOC114761183 [Prosopis alba]
MTKQLLFLSSFTLSSSVQCFIPQSSTVFLSSFTERVTVGEEVAVQPWFEGAVLTVTGGMHLLSPKGTFKGSLLSSCGLALLISDQSNQASTTSTTVHTSNSSPSTSVLRPEQASITQEQYDQILKLLRKEQDDIAVNVTDCPDETFSGLVAALPKSFCESHWILDSGATCHVVNSVDMFDTVDRYTGPIKMIKVPNGSRMLITHDLIRGQTREIDVWGPYKRPSYKFYRYFLTIVDDYTRCTWTFLLVNKSDTVYHLKNFLAYVHTQFTSTVKKIRSDNGLEFVNAELQHYLQSKGIIHETSCPYTPQQNGVVERKHRHLLDVARSLLFQSGIPLKFWGEAIKTATFLINRTPSSTLGHKTPFELLYGYPPDLSFLRVFGCLAFATNLNIQDKFQNRSEPCVFLGYPGTQKGYLLYNLQSHNFCVSGHVIFDETRFPFQDAAGLNQGGAPHNDMIDPLEQFSHKYDEEAPLPITFRQDTSSFDHQDTVGDKHAYSI